MHIQGKVKGYHNAHAFHRPVCKNEDSVGRNPIFECVEWVVTSTAADKVHGVLNPLAASADLNCFSVRNPFTRSFVRIKDTMGDHYNGSDMAVSSKICMHKQGSPLPPDRSV